MKYAMAFVYLSLVMSMSCGDKKSNRRAYKSQKVSFIWDGISHQGSKNWKLNDAANKSN